MGAAFEEFNAYIRTTTATAGPAAPGPAPGPDASGSDQADDGAPKDPMEFPMWMGHHGGVGRIRIEPGDQVLEAGGMRLGYTAIAVANDDSTVAIPNNLVTWATSKSDVASIDKNGWVVTEYDGVAIISATFGSLTDKSKVTVKSPKLIDIGITPENPSLVGGGNVDFAVSTVYENLRGSKEYKRTSPKNDSKVTWTSSAPQVATIDQAGHATIKNVGKAVITATVDGVSNTTTLTVTPQSAAAKKTSVEINVLDADGAEINGIGIVVFRHKTCQDVKVEAPIRGGYFYVAPTIDPHGNMEFRAASKDKKRVSASSSVPYDLRSGDGMQFTAKQNAGQAHEQTGDGTTHGTGRQKSHTTGHTKTHTTGHKTSDELEDKSTTKGHVGVEIGEDKVGKIGGGVDMEGETTRKHTREDSEEDSEQDSQQDTEQESEENSQSHQKQVGTDRPFGLEGFDLKQTK